MVNCAGITKRRQQHRNIDRCLRDSTHLPKSDQKSTWHMKVREVLTAVACRGEFQPNSQSTTRFEPGSGLGNRPAKTKPRGVSNAVIKAARIAHCNGVQWLSRTTNKILHPIIACRLFQCVLVKLAKCLTAFSQSTNTSNYQINWSYPTNNSEMIIIEDNFICNQQL